MTLSKTRDHFYCYFVVSVTRDNMMAYAIGCGVVVVLLTILWRHFRAKKSVFHTQYLHDNGRPLGVMENWLRHGHDTDGYLILASTQVLRSKKPITGPVVRKAMELLMNRHPMLRMCTKKAENGDYQLQKMANARVDLRELDTNDWKTVMEDSSLEKFDGDSGPLWRVTFLPNARYEPVTEEDMPEITSYPHECICVFACHHIVADGSSYARMFSEFMKFVGKLLNNEEPKVTSMSMLPPLDLYMDEVIQGKWYRNVLQLVLEMLCLIPGFSGFMMSKMYGGNVFTRKHGVEIQRNPHIQSRTKIIPVEFTKVETSSLLKMCKEQKANVQGAIQTAAGVAMVTMLEAEEYEVESNVTVNIRPFLKSKVPDNYAGAYFSLLQCKNLIVSSPDANKFWSMARQASSDLHARLSKNEHFQMWTKLKALLLVMTRMIGGAPKDDRSGARNEQLLVFSNLGHAKFLDGSPDDDVILRAGFGCTAVHQRGSVFNNNIATFNGKLFWSVIYYSNIVSDATAQRFANLVKETILKGINEFKD